MFADLQQLLPLSAAVVYGISTNVRFCFVKMKPQQANANKAKRKTMKKLVQKEIF